MKMSVTGQHLCPWNRSEQKGHEGAFSPAPDDVLRGWGDKKAKYKGIAYIIAR